MENNSSRHFSDISLGRKQRAQPTLPFRVSSEVEDSRNHRSCTFLPLDANTEHPDRPYEANPSGGCSQLANNKKALRTIRHCSEVVLDDSATGESAP
jgi:hypothetical protein